jgi:hypothetical protein
MELRCATRKGLARPSAVSNSTYQDVTISIIRGQFISHLHSFLHFIQEVNVGCYRARMPKQNLRRFFA